MPLPLRMFYIVTSYQSGTAVFTVFLWTHLIAIILIERSQLCLLISVANRTKTKNGIFTEYFEKTKWLWYPVPVAL